MGDRGGEVSNEWMNGDEVEEDGRKKKKLEECQRIYIKGQIQSGSDKISICAKVERKKEKKKSYRKKRKKEKKK